MPALLEPKMAQPTFLMAVRLVRTLQNVWSGEADVVGVV